jgi:hypothetical protein
MIKTKLSVSNTNRVPTGDAPQRRRSNPFENYRTSTRPATQVQARATSDAPSNDMPNYKSPNFGNPHLVESWKGKI